MVWPSKWRSNKMLFIVEADKIFFSRMKRIGILSVCWKNAIASVYVIYRYRISMWIEWFDIHKFNDSSKNDVGRLFPIFFIESLIRLELLFMHIFCNFIKNKTIANAQNVIWDYISQMKFSRKISNIVFSHGLFSLSLTQLTVAKKRFNAFLFNMFDTWSVSFYVMCVMTISIYCIYFPEFCIAYLLTFTYNMHAIFFYCAPSFPSFCQQI